jgi:hypothetical protein
LLLPSLYRFWVKLSCPGCSSIVGIAQHQAWKQQCICPSIHTEPSLDFFAQRTCFVLSTS